MKIFIFVIIFTLESVSVFGADIQPFLVNGTVVDQAKYPSIVRTETVECTGTVVGPRVVLTAAHCNAVITSQVTFKIHGRDYITTLTNSPYYNDNFLYDKDSLKDLLTSDLALGLLEEPVDIRPSSIGGVAKPGAKTVLFGYGCYDPLPKHHDEKLRAGPNKIDRIDKSGMLIRVPDGHGASGCPGDSGGPTFVQDANGRSVLIGVHSQVGLTADRGRLPETWDARTDLPIAQEFFKEFAAENHVDICGITLNCN